ncbi:MAG TPA: hypothetical protein VN634_07555 [Candidatus Limnocylindrales bacterium]|nr:hypothetical protein [Candidatus Limnocylindrales bacterium]
MKPRSDSVLRARLAAVLLASAIVLPASTSFAEWNSTYPPDGDHPLRIAHYFIDPIGRFLEWTVTRPMARVGAYVAPYEHIDSRSFSGCSRERPARSCTNVIK